MSTDMDRIIRRLSIRLVPFLCLLYFISYLDRVNISFAALQMNEDLGLSATAYGFGSSVFFVGYLLFQVPSNLLVARVGVKRWLTFIMVLWGLVSMGMSLVNSDIALYVLRFLLGAAEAGFLPAVLVYLGKWFPRQYRGRVNGLFFLALPMSSVLGAPVSTAILEYVHNVGGLSGWQWLFILEGLPAVLLGFTCLKMLQERPTDATWLSREDAEALEATLRVEEADADAAGTHRLIEAFRDRRVLVLTAVFLLTASGSYAVGFWLPQILKGLVKTDMGVGWLTAALYVLAVVGIVFWTRHSDAKKERYGHLAAASCVGGAGFVICAFMLETPVVATLGLGLACIGTFTALPIFWTVPNTFLTGTALAVAVAFINATGQLSGIVIPWFIGWSKDTTGGFAFSIGGVGVLLLLAAVTILAFGRAARTREVVTV